MTRDRDADAPRPLAAPCWRLCAVPRAAVAAATAKPRRRKAAGGGRAAATPPRPDRALYAGGAGGRWRRPAASPARLAQRAEWETVVLRFRRVVARYPQSAYCDDALLAHGDLYRHMATRFKAALRRATRSQAYRSPGGRVPEQPARRRARSVRVFELARARGDRKRIADAGRAYLDAFPARPRANDVKAQLTQARARAGGRRCPRPPPPGLAQVFNLRFWSGESSTRVVLDVEKQVPLQLRPHPATPTGCGSTSRARACTRT